MSEYEEVAAHRVAMITAMSQEVGERAATDLVDTLLNRLKMAEGQEK